jgi:GT2 family glycosyltransferase
MALDRNVGYAAGNNAAIAEALRSDHPPRYVLLLNPDTVPRPGAVAALVQFLDDHPGVGIAGSRLEDADGTPQRSAFQFPTVLGELEDGLRLGVCSRLLRQWAVAPPPPEEAGPCDWVAGASLIVRREVFEVVGLLDEEYFLYFEEVDFCRRARAAGWPCWYVPASRVVHLVGRSSGVTGPDAARWRRPAYWFRSRRRYFLLHLGPARTTLADLAWASGFAAHRLRRAVLRRPDVDPPFLLWDFLRFNVLGASA